MSNVIQLHRTTAGQARGAGIATAIMASRYGLPAEEARRMGEQAKAMVERGFSAAHARSAMLSKLRRLAPVAVA